jgi:thiamine-phosphate pyrophosphorylase
MLEQTAAALQASEPGRIAVQLRDKDASDRRLLRAGRALRAITSRRQAELLLNGRADLARALGADGVHLPETGVGPQAVRELLGPHARIGVSCHDAEGLARAAAGGADYVTLGPLGPVAGKGAPLGWERFAEWTARCPLPVLALGGVGPENVAEVIAAGGAGIAVIRAVYRQADPAAAVRHLLRELDSARRGRR